MDFDNDNLLGELEDYLDNIPASNNSNSNNINFNNDPSITSPPNHILDGGGGGINNKLNAKFTSNGNMTAATKAALSERLRAQMGSAEKRKMEDPMTNVTESSLPKSQKLEHEDDDFASLLDSSSCNDMNSNSEDTGGGGGGPMGGRPGESKGPGLLAQALMEKKGRYPRNNSNNFDMGGNMMGRPRNGESLIGNEGGRLTNNPDDLMVIKKLNEIVHSRNLDNKDRTAAVHKLMRENPSVYQLLREHRSKKNGMQQRGVGAGGGPGNQGMMNSNLNGSVNNGSPMANGNLGSSGGRLSIDSNVALMNDLDSLQGNQQWNQPSGPTSVPQKQQQQQQQNMFNMQQMSNGPGGPQSQRGAGGGYNAMNQFGGQQVMGGPMENGQMFHGNAPMDGANGGMWNNDPSQYSNRMMNQQHGPPPAYPRGNQRIRPGMHQMSPGGMGGHFNNMHEPMMNGMPVRGHMFPGQRMMAGGMVDMHHRPMNPGFMMHTGMQGHGGARMEGNMFNGGDFISGPGTGRGGMAAMGSMRGGRGGLMPMGPGSMSPRMNHHMKPSQASPNVVMGGDFPMQSGQQQDPFNNHGFGQGDPRIPGGMMGNTISGGHGENFMAQNSPDLMGGGDMMGGHNGNHFGPGNKILMQHQPQNQQLNPQTQGRSNTIPPHNDLVTEFELESKKYMQQQQQQQQQNDMHSNSIDSTSFPAPWTTTLEGQKHRTMLRNKLHQALVQDQPSLLEEAFHMETEAFNSCDTLPDYTNRIALWLAGVYERTERNNAQPDMMPNSECSPGTGSQQQQQPKSEPVSPSVPDISSIQDFLPSNEMSNRSPASKATTINGPASVSSAAPASPRSSVTPSPKSSSLSEQNPILSKKLLPSSNDASVNSNNMAAAANTANTPSTADHASSPASIGSPTVSSPTSSSSIVVSSSSSSSSITSSSMMSSASANSSSTSAATNNNRTSESGNGFQSPPPFQVPGSFEETKSPSANTNATSNSGNLQKGTRRASGKGQVNNPYSVDSGIGSPRSNTSLCSPKVQGTSPSLVPTSEGSPEK